MRTLLKLMKPTRVRGHRRRARRSTGRARWRTNAHTNYALRKNGRRRSIPIHPELEEPLRADPRPHLPPARLPGADHGHRPAAGRIHARTAPTCSAARWARRRQRCWQPECDKFQAGMPGNGATPRSPSRPSGTSCCPSPDTRSTSPTPPAYGLVSYWTAYLKANFPAEYMAALLTSVGDDKDKMAIYLADARKMGDPGLSPDVNESVADFTAVGDDVRFGLRSVRNVGEGVIESLIETPQEQGQVHLVPRLPGQGRGHRAEQAGRRIPDQGRCLRLARTHPQGTLRRARGRHRRGHPGEEAGGLRTGRPVRRNGRGQ